MIFLGGKKDKGWIGYFVFGLFAVAVGVVFRVVPMPINFVPLLLMVILYGYSKKYLKNEHLPSYVDLLLLVAIIICSFVAITFIPEQINNFSGLQVNILKVSVFGVATIGFSIIITLLFGDLELSLIFAVLLSQLGLAVEGGSLNIGGSLLCAALSAVMCSYRLRRRSQIIKAGVLSVLVFFLAYLLESSQSLFIITAMSWEMLRSTVIIGGVASVIMMIVLPVIIPGILNIFEYIFKVVTNLSLLEYADFNQPLLRKLILEAPGTYQHSLVVANLSESAAEAIDANSLLVRVGAYYHDVGKLLKPNYFVENVASYKDAHKDLKPSMSKLIIMNHVKDGIELAKKYKINPRIIDFIEEHHGKTLVYYFYHKALQLEPESKHEEEYRYPGPKAQTKETAIVSLADTVEAVSRTLEEPTPARIEEMVRAVIRKRFMEGELDESSLTLKELEKITQCFIRTLCAIFHTRINYPKDENRNNKSTKNKES
ncbi:MAG: HDIG domain-containing protein [Candidatus Omnitrophica bacterium]|nr:HDIG domain-containing protein [Candidatus Omnitrophota bacterium]